MVFCFSIFFTTYKNVYLIIFLINKKISSNSAYIEMNSPYIIFSKYVCNLLSSVIL